MKYTIFRSRTEKKLPTKEKVRKIIAELIDEEKNLATKAGKLHLHLQKWEYLHNVINEPVWKIVYVTCKTCLQVLL